MNKKTFTIASITDVIWTPSFIGIRASLMGGQILYL